MNAKQGFTMHREQERSNARAQLEASGFSKESALRLMADAPALGDNWERDGAAYSGLWQHAQAMLEQLPQKKARTAAQQAVAQTILDQTRELRETYLRAHAPAVYRCLTNGMTRLARVEELAYTAGKLLPGLTPTQAMVGEENRHQQKDKDGHEIDQGIFFGHVLADEQCGKHLCHAMLLPHPRTASVLDEFLKTGKADLGTASVARGANATTVYLQNPRYMNAEDDSTVDNVEIGVDLCNLDPNNTIAVMRGGEIDRGKHQGKRAFCSGVNLTHIYHGKLSYLWYLKREMGFINKVYRGVASAEHSPDEILGRTSEKLWIAAIDQFAIGGGCQYLLVMDVNIAGEDAYMTLPARKEGIIPGAANMRLPRFVNDRVTRQAIMMDRRLDCASPEGRMVCDYIVPNGEIDAAVEKTIKAITESGVVSASSNRKAMRVAQEPLDMFRRFMAVYAHEQAYCHFSPALMSNLERYWDAGNRKM